MTHLAARTIDRCVRLVVLIVLGGLALVLTAILGWIPPELAAMLGSRRQP